MALQLRPMEDEEFVAWLPLLREDHAQDLVLSETDSTQFYESFPHKAKPGYGLYATR